MVHDAEDLLDDEDDGGEYPHQDEAVGSSDEAPQKGKAGRPPGVKTRGGKSVLFDKIENKAGTYFGIIDQYIRQGRKEDLKDRSATAMKMLELRFGKAPTRADEDKGKKRTLNANLMSMADLKEKHGKKE